eukprot:195867_1
MTAAREDGEKSTWEQMMSLSDAEQNLGAKHASVSNRVCATAFKWQLPCTCLRRNNGSSRHRSRTKCPGVENGPVKLRQQIIEASAPDNVLCLQCEKIYSKEAASRHFDAVHSNVVSEPCAAFNAGGSCTTCEKSR